MDLKFYKGLKPNKVIIWAEIQKINRARLLESLIVRGKKGIPNLKPFQLNSLN